MMSAKALVFPFAAPPSAHRARVELIPKTPRSEILFLDWTQRLDSGGKPVWSASKPTTEHHCFLVGGAELRELGIEAELLVHWRHSAGDCRCPQCRGLEKNVTIAEEKLKQELRSSRGRWGWVGIGGLRTLSSFLYDRAIVTRRGNTLQVYSRSGGVFWKVVHVPLNERGRRKSVWTYSF